MKLLLLITILCMCLAGAGQQTVVTGGRNTFSGKFIRTDSGIFINCYHTRCKQVLTVTHFVRLNDTCKTTTALSQVAIKKIALITVHGNISYDFFYRSGTDTFLEQGALYQHTEKVSLNVMLKEKYPFKVGLVLRQSNSPYYKNFEDVNLQFDHFGYYKDLKQQALNKLSAAYNDIPSLTSLKDLIAGKEKQQLQLKGWLQSPATLQKLIEEREKAYAHRSRSGTDEKQQTISSPFETTYQERTDESDSLAKQLKLLHKNADSISNDLHGRLVRAKQKVYTAKSESDIRKVVAENGISIGLPNRLAAIRTFSVGRTVLNYTELTAQNITVTGVNVEYNPGYYAAFAAGTIDYRFRDYFNRKSAGNGQYLALARIGIGDPESNALIFTAFQGRKNSSEFAPAADVVNYVNVMGYSIESILKKDNNSSISFEVAKSTKPVTGSLLANKQLNTLWKFNDLSNLGVNVKGEKLIAATNTRLSGFYRKTGENYQSFSLFTYHSDQTAWLGRADQIFL